MLTYQIHNIETAPEKSKPLLELFTEVVGFVPNLAGAIANSPVLANSLLKLFQNVHNGSFTGAELQVLLLTNAVTNSCNWAVAFHTALGLKQELDPRRRSSHPRTPVSQPAKVRRSVPICENTDREARACH
jgi:hypothetical protein